MVPKSAYFHCCQSLDREEWNTVGYAHPPSLHWRDRQAYTINNTGSGDTNAIADIIGVQLFSQNGNATADFKFNVHFTRQNDWAH